MSFSQILLSGCNGLSSINGNILEFSIHGVRKQGKCFVACEDKKSPEMFGVYARTKNSHALDETVWIADFPSLEEAQNAVTAIVLYLSPEDIWEKARRGQWKCIAANGGVCSILDLFQRRLHDMDAQTFDLICDTAKNIREQNIF